MQIYVSFCKFKNSYLIFTVIIYCINIKATKYIDKDSETVLWSIQVICWRPVYLWLVAVSWLETTPASPL